jgi:hypothetical protein
VRENQGICVQCYFALSVNSILPVTDGQYYFDYVLTTYNERVVSAPVKYNERDKTLLIKVGTASKDVDLSYTDGERAKANSSITEAPKKDTALENKMLRRHSGWLMSA